VAEHAADCGCTRCTGFTTETAVENGRRGGLVAKHGAYEPGRVRKVAAEYLARLHVEAPTGDVPHDALALEQLAILLAKIHLAHDWIDDHGVVDGNGDAWPVLRDVAKWQNTARKLMDSLGLTAASRSQLQLNVRLGDLIELAEAQAGFRTSIQTAIETAAVVAGELFGLDERDEFVRMFRGRYLPAVNEALMLPPAPDEPETLS
jgi:hypothetical protein